MTKKIDHITFTSYKAGMPVCGIEREEGLIYAHLPSMIKDKDINDWIAFHVKCPDCVEIIQDTIGDVE
jgi:hypothetical protein